MQPTAPTEPGYALVFRGRLMKTPFPVRTFLDHGMRFGGRFRSHTSVIVSHWTGGEGPPHVLYQTLKNHVRKDEDGKVHHEPLSVHFCVDPEGKVYQFADTELRCSHTGTEANDFSIGIEFIGRGSDFKVPAKGAPRRRLSQTVHGRQVVFDSLTDAQIKVGVQLNETLCDLYALPLQVPLNSAGRIQNTELPALVATRYKGCVEHLHLTMRKVDCCLVMMSAIKQRAEELAGRV